MEIEDHKIVCECLKVNAKEIRDAIKDGCRDLNSLADRLEVGTACQKCKCMEIDKKYQRKYHLKEDFLDNL